MKIENVILSFPSIWEHASYQGVSRERYEATLLIPKGSPQADAVKDEVARVGKEVLGDAWKKARLCFTDAELKDYDGWEGNWALKVTTKKKPVILDSDASALTEEDNKPQGGDIVNAAVSFYAYTNTYGKFVACQLAGLQFVAEGDRYTSNSVDVLSELTPVGEPTLKASNIEAGTEDAPF